MTNDEFKVIWTKFENYIEKYLKELNEELEKEKKKEIDIIKLKEENKLLKDFIKNCKNCMSKK